MSPPVAVYDTPATGSTVTFCGKSEPGATGRNVTVGSANVPIACTEFGPGFTTQSPTVAMPFAPVVTVELEPPATVPPPPVTENCTLTFGTGLPRCVDTSADGGIATGEPAGA